MGLKTGSAFLALAGALMAAEPKDFLVSYCIGCHGPSVQMANRRVDNLKLPPPDGDSLLLVQEILDKLTLGAMPPKAAKQPPEAEKRSTIESLTRMAAESRAALASTGGRTVLRRLNRREYLNSIGDLLGINMLMFDPTPRFPRDQTVEHMDNIGDALLTSGYLLEQYMEAADQAVEKASKIRERPKPREWVFKGPFSQQASLDGSHEYVFQKKFMVLYSALNSVTEEGAYGPLQDFAQGVPMDGYYDITVQAEALNRRNPYNADMFKSDQNGRVKKILTPKGAGDDTNLFNMDSGEPLRLGVVPGNAKVGALHKAQPIEPHLAEVAMGDKGPEWHTFHVWLDAGYSPRFIFPNGIGFNDGRGAFALIERVLPAEEKASVRKSAFGRIAVMKYGKLPQIRIYEVHVKGPIVDTWPLPNQRLLLGDKPFEAGRTREILGRFATRAYRRPVMPGELDALMAVVEHRRKDGKTPFDALKDGFKAVLCSPAFLYLEEPVTQADGGRALTNYALAARLSYFLWSTIPDPELSKAAAARELSKPAVLLAQTRRMLADPRSQAFVNGFLDSWLNLRSLGDMPPDRDAFERYYMQDLQGAMKTETRMFTRYLLDHNESIVNFLDSRFTFLNKPLSRLYGMSASIPNADGNTFRKVEITDPRRGGLLGMASVLTVSANGIDTSPVTRGVWILENVFGTPPPPPPDNVPTIDPDVRGTKTIRDLLTKHRESAACMSCHAKIDPPGFALENFDPIGVWRAKYANGAAIDATGQLPGGSFENVVGFKKLLVERKDDFARALTDRLLTYACGRRIETFDRPRVDAIQRQLAQRGYGFRDLVELLVSSDIFQEK